MDALVGHVSLLLAFLSATFGAMSILISHYKKNSVWAKVGYLQTYIVLALVIAAVVAMEQALISHNFTIAYVANNNSKQTPLLYSITGLWSALQGSILLWVLILVGYIATVAFIFRKKLSDNFIKTVLVISLLVAIFFLALVVWPANPFSVISGKPPADGIGPNPLLQDNILVAVHPVFLYLGFVGFTIPFAFAIASLITKRVGEGWLAETRRFTLIAWACLSIGIVLGAWWSYQTLGWGGFWGWDPVENAALLPWLTGTAYLHSAMAQDRRGLLRVWNLSLLIATFALTILGTFLTRSGVIVSVHAFSDSTLGPVLLAFFALVTASGIFLIAWRGDVLSASGSIDAPLSREGAFLLNNLLFAAFAGIVLIGTVFPLLVQALNNQSVSIGAPFFDAFTAPIGLCLLFLMAIAPALPWRKTSGTTLRSRLLFPVWAAFAVLFVCVLTGVRGFTPLLAFTLGAFAAAAALRQIFLACLAAKKHGQPFYRGLIGRTNGGMVVHLGVVAIAVALAAATSFAHRTQLSIATGQTAYFDQHSFTFLGWEKITTPSENGVEGLVKIDGGGIFKPGVASFDGNQQGTGIPSIDSSVSDDVYLSLASGPASLPSKTSLVVEVYVQPLVMWMWVGGGMIFGGALLAAFPGKRRKPTEPSSIYYPALAKA